MKYDPQSAGINLQSPQSDSTPWILTLFPAAVHGKIHIPNILWLTSLCSLLVFTGCLIKEKQLLLVSTHEKGLTNELFCIIFG